MHYPILHMYTYIGTRWVRGSCYDSKLFWDRVILRIRVEMNKEGLVVFRPRIFIYQLCD